MPTKTLLTCLASAALLLPTLATARPAYTVEPMRIHAGPGPDYPLIVVVPPASAWKSRAASAATSGVMSSRRTACAAGPGAAR